MINIVIAAGVIITILTAIPVVMQMRNHPKGLFVLFFAEMWERFSYYGMRALLIFYLTKHFLFSDEKASQQYASYTTLVYLLPLIGGLMADKYLGTRKAIVFGAILLVLGHGGMALEGSPNVQTLTHQGATYEFVREGSHMSNPLLKVGDDAYAVAPTKSGGIEIVGLPAGSVLPPVLESGSFETGVKKITPWAEHAFFLSISLIIMGVGYLKPNISSIVGQLYPDKDPRRDSGFTLYYYGINLGGFWAAILCGLLGETYGWGYGFGLAGLGMLAGLVVFVLGKPWLQGNGEPPVPEQLKKPVAGPISQEWLIYGISILALPVIYFMVQRNTLVGWVLLASSVAIIGYVIMMMVTKFSREENFRLGLAFVLIFASVIFFTLFEQAGSSLNLFAGRNTNLNLIDAPVIFNLLGQSVVLATPAQLAALTVPTGYIFVDMTLTASQVQSFNSGFILIFAPVFAAVFTFLGRRGADPDPVKKFSFGLVNVGLGFMLLVWGANFADGAFQVPLMFLALTYLLHTWGELALSPVGLSQITKLSPPVIVSTMMAIWFLASSAAQYLAGIIAGLTSTETVGGQVLDQEAALKSSLDVFWTIGLWGVGLGAGLFVLSFFIKHWSYGANDTTSESAH
ncbi:oligopeptide:H+ symporter [Asticcacaulis sp. ZE23SCel15]|uniref:peptide MFS transporter n=1 Tax=Asticcacaulis sp. ZE23SCel15 TaxID=3059027 RepID=UPI00265D7634|nr:oligopeptide:H+ symporter [Asticcacaulis sp. ZE23SCel15]WKL56907.1 oligopeptide:H+ symporter [Asticcacaulis sp. ZE23SCel15]